LAFVALRIPNFDGENRPILDPARHQSRPVAALRAVEAEGDGIAVFERTKIWIKAPIPFRRSDPTVLSGIDLVQKLASRLGDVVLDVENRLDQRVDVEPDSVASCDFQPLSELAEQPVVQFRVFGRLCDLRDRRVSRSLKSVVEKTGVHRVAREDVLIRVPVLFSVGVLTRAVSVADREHPTATETGLVNVTLNDVSHFVAVVVLQPP